MHVLFKLLKSNLRMLYIRERFILSLILLCSFCSGVMIPFIYGIYTNYSEKLNAQLYELTLLQIRLAENDTGDRVSKNTLNDFFLALPDELTDQVEMFFVRCKDNSGKNVECRFTIQNRQYRSCKVFRDNLLQSGNLNGYFSENEESSGEKVAIVPEAEADVGDNVLVFGEKYRVAATHNRGDNLTLIPFPALEENVEFDDYGVVLAFKKRITEEQFDIVGNAVMTFMEDMADMPDMPQLNQYQMLFYKSLIILVGLVAVSVSLNYVIAYQYINNKRKKELAVFLICGMTKNKAVILLMMECAALSLPGIALGSGVFHLVIRLSISRLMPYLSDGYNLKIYVLIIVVFGVVFELFFGLTQMFIMKKQDISNMVRDTGKCK